MKRKYEQSDIKNKLDTRIIGKNLIFFDEIESTNDYLKENINQFSEGTVVVSRSQTKGRGRRGNNWENGADEGIFMSILLKPNQKINSALRISLVCALSIFHSLEFTKLPIKIKWPNDLTINSKKVGGILTEIVSIEDVDSIENSLIIGIGINVNNTSFPDEIKDNATSLKLEKGNDEDFDIADIIALICKNVEKSYYTYLSERFKFFIDDYKQNCSNIMQEVKLIYSDKEETGTVLDINRDGSILFKSYSGEIKSVSSGDVSLKVSN